MNRDFERLLEQARLRPLDEGERVRLQEILNQNVGLRQRWGEEQALSRLLDRTLNVPLSQDFTDRVLGQVGALPSGRGGTRGTAALRRLWVGLPRPVLHWAAALAVLVGGGLGYLRYQNAYQERLASSVASISLSVQAAAEVSQLPPVQIWLDYEPIARLGQTESWVDEELLEVLE